MSAPGPILQLVERFQQNAEAYKSGHYNETQLRLEFVNPFFKCLGWDMDNVQGYAEAYKDVIHEDAIKVGGVTKAPDYCFRIGGTRKFFLEAKKPSVNIKDDPAPEDVRRPRDRELRPIAGVAQWTSRLRPAVAVLSKCG